MSASRNTRRVEPPPVRLPLLPGGAGVSCPKTPLAAAR